MTSLNLANKRLANAVFICDHGLAARVSPNSCNPLHGELRKVVSLASSLPLHYLRVTLGPRISATPNHIGDIIFRRSPAQMLWINAQAVVARMNRVWQGVRRRPIHFNKHEPVRAANTPTPIFFDAKLPVTMRPRLAEPQPATRPFFNLAPKAVIHGFIIYEPIRFYKENSQC